jgi:four helix bundle protein
MTETQGGNRDGRKEFAKELEKRTLEFAVSMIKLSARLPNTVEGKIVRNQITKSGTSIGANYREANRSRSRADFKNKIKICESEASETQYWLELIPEAGWLSATDTNAERDECGQLLALFATIAKNC